MDDLLGRRLISLRSCQTREEKAHEWKEEKWALRIIGMPGATQKVVSYGALQRFD
jgi:hypothetical protein